MSVADLIKQHIRDRGSISPEEIAEYQKLANMAGAQQSLPQAAARARPKARRLSEAERQAVLAEYGSAKYLPPTDAVPGSAESILRTYPKPASGGAQTQGDQDRARMQQLRQMLTSPRGYSHTESYEAPMLPNIAASLAGVETPTRGVPVEEAELAEMLIGIPARAAKTGVQVARQAARAAPEGGLRTIQQQGLRALPAPRGQGQLPAPSVQELLRLPAPSKGLKVPADTMTPARTATVLNEMGQPQMAREMMSELEMLRRPSSGRPEFLENAPDGLYAGAPGVAPGELETLNHLLPKTGKGKSFNDLLSGEPGYAGRFSGRPPLSGDELPQAIRGGGPDGLYQHQDLLDRLATAGQDVGVMSRKSNPEDEMRSLSALIDSILGGSNRVPARVRPQTKNLSPYGKMGDVDAFEFANGGYVRG